MAAIEGRSREVLRDPNFCHVATIGKGGAPHVAVVWVDVDDAGDVLLNTAEGRIWPQNLRRDPRVALTVVNGENPYEYVMVRGHAAEITHEGADEHIDALAKKYLGLDDYPYRRRDEVRLIVRIRPERVSHRAP